MKWLTHCNNVSSGVVHAVVVLGGPLETDTRPGFEPRMIFSESSKHGTADPSRGSDSLDMRV